MAAKKSPKQQVADVKAAIQTLIRKIDAIVWDD